MKNANAVIPNAFAINLHHMARKNKAEMGVAAELADTSAIEERGEFTPSVGQAEKPGWSIVERARGIERSEHPIMVDGQVVGVERVRRTCVDSRQDRWSERTEVCDAGGRTVRFIKEVEYRPVSESFDVFRRRTPDGGLLREVKKLGDYYVKDFDPNARGAQPIAEMTFDSQGNLTYVVKRTLARVEKQNKKGEPLFLFPVAAEKEVQYDRQSQKVVKRRTCERKVDEEGDINQEVEEIVSVRSRDFKGSRSERDTAIWREGETEHRESQTVEYKTDSEESRRVPETWATGGEIVRQEIVNGNIVEQATERFKYVYVPVNPEVLREMTRDQLGQLYLNDNTFMRRESRPDGVSSYRQQFDSEGRRTSFVFSAEGEEFSRVDSTYDEKSGRLTEERCLHRGESFTRKFSYSRKGECSVIVETPTTIRKYRQMDNEDIARNERGDYNDRYRPDGAYLLESVTQREEAA